MSWWNFLNAGAAGGSAASEVYAPITAGPSFGSISGTAPNPSSFSGPTGLPDTNTSSPTFMEWLKRFNQFSSALPRNKSQESKTQSPQLPPPASARPQMGYPTSLVSPSDAYINNLTNLMNQIQMLRGASYPTRQNRLY